MSVLIPNMLSEEQINTILSLPDVIFAKKNIDKQAKGSVYFSIQLTADIKAALLEQLGLDLSMVDSVPMRWIKGDTLPHVDRGVSNFEKTHLVYLTESDGELIVDGTAYPINKGSGYVFSEGLSHETVGTGIEPRLLIGPMSEQGIQVGGATTIVADGEIDTIYFRQIGFSVQYKINTDGTYLGISLPVTITNTNTNTSFPLKVLFETDMTFYTIIWYFTCGSDNIQFGSISLNSDGTRPTITIDGVSNYPGLIENNNSNISIYNLIVNSNGSTLVSGGGWIGQEYFARNSTGNLIVNCSTNGDISTSGGGIVGAFSAQNASSLTIRACTSSGDIDTNGGGIAGAYSGNSNGLLTITRCSSSGSIGTNAGGILGTTCGSGGVATVTNCYSTGAITGGGGIFGEQGGAGGTASATNCYSTGVINNGGGIFGVYAAAEGSATAVNCFSTGAMINNSGGIYSANGDGATAYNCDSSGSIDGTSNGIWAGFANDNQNGENNYSEAAHGNSGSWSTTNAAAYLTGVPSSSYYGTTWCLPVVGGPYQLSLSGYSPYSLSLTESTSQTVAAGSASTGDVVPGYTVHTILAINGGLPSANPGITINNATGVISVISSQTAGTYTLYVYSSTNPYSITQFTLTTTSGGGGSSAPVLTPCCALPMDLPKFDYTKRNEVISGNFILGDPIRRTPFPDYSFYYAMKMAQASKNGKN